MRLGEQKKKGKGRERQLTCRQRLKRQANEKVKVKERDSEKKLGRKYIGVFNITKYIEEKHMRKKCVSCSRTYML